MAGVTDQCPKCGTTITAPPESTLEPVRRKTKFAPVPKSEADSEHLPPPPAQPELPALPGWSASELADALKPPAPLPSYVPVGQSLAHAQPQLHTPERSLLPDPPAIPDPGPVFMPKRKAQSEGAVAVAPPPPAAPAKSDHPILGSILDAPTLPRGRATAPTPAPAPAWESPPAPDSAPEAPELPAPAAFLMPEPLPPPASLPEQPAQVSEPAPVEAAPSPPPLPPPPLAEAPAEEPIEQPAPVLSESPALESLTPTPAPAEEQAPTAPESLPESLASALTGQPLDAPTALAPTPEVASTPIALVPESLPDARAAEEAAMPGMGEVLAGGQIAQDPAAPPDTRDHRPLLHVPFLPVAESPSKGRRTQKRKMYILGVVLFLVIDVFIGFWLLNAPRGALSEGTPTESTPKPTVPPTPSSAKTETNATPPASPGTPAIGAPSEFAATQPEPSPEAAPAKPSSPPMAIPLPGHSATDVPTATPIPVTEASTPADPKKTEPEASPPPASSTTAGMNPSAAPVASPDTGKQPVKPENAVAAGPDEPSWLLKAGPKSGDAAGPTTPAPTAPAPPTPAPAAPGGDGTVASMMGPQPTPAPTPSGEDPPWLRRIQPTFPAIDGTPLLPSTPQQPVGPPPPAPPAPGAVDGSTIPPLAATTNMSVTPAPGVEGAPAPAPTPAPAPASTATLIGKLPDEAKNALEVLRSFLAAPTWQERSAYVQKPEATKSLMEKHAAKYGDGPINPGMIKFVDRHPGRDGGPPYCMFEIEGGDLKHEVLILIEQPAEGSPKIDWPTFVEFKDDLLLRFLETQGEPNQSFRVMLSRKHYFAKDVPDLASKDSFQVQQPNDRFDGHVFLPKSTQLSKKLASQLSWNQNMPVIVELAWRTNGKLHWVEIVRIVSYGWRS
ncbi:hypothetical protein DES53_109180 [Roseimicrobium gellanilyticum]|uniref:Uncharacterized protein n=2 Tax=Roseimicrobium gellanilyticum TaxID=748857 RepID=A0A366HBN3_9BACT|nr:hypothetical protein DES53_109180 [Roseimicrobium gellanilyticum]